LRRLLAINKQVQAAAAATMTLEAFLHMVATAVQEL
jgi:hypothetical protein